MKEMQNAKQYSMKKNLQMLNISEVGVEHQINALLDIMSNLIGTEQMVLKATKLGVVKYLRSSKIKERALALKRLIYEDPTLTLKEDDDNLEVLITNLTDKISEIIARKALEEQLEQRVVDKMQAKQEEYLKELKMQVIKEENPNPENAQTLKRLAILEKLSLSGLKRSAMEVLRPAALEQVIGQEMGIKSLLAKMASPYPQHILIYGPPGVGKTSAARLVLETIKKAKYSPFSKEAPFIEVDGTTLRWDPREVTNPLIGSVHDPIYQGARRDFAETGIPEPKLGLVTEAHGGVLFIDEIGEMDPILQNKLLKVLEDKRVKFESAYYDPGDANIPQYIKKLFEEGAPADFVLVGATTRDAQDISPAIRSRCAEVYFEPLSQEHVQKIIQNAAEKLEAEIEGGVPALISEYTIEGRKAINLLADAYGLALYRDDYQSDNKIRITKLDICEVLQVSRMTPYIIQRSSSNKEVGRVFGLGVSGFLGSVIEIEAVAFQARKNGEGRLRFNDTAGSMAKDSVFNASSVIRKLIDADLNDYDIHVNIIGGGNIDGPSAGLAVCMAVYSAITEKELSQDIAVTGELSIQGRIKPVGGIFEKIYGARQAGMKKVLLPEENRADVPRNISGIEVIYVDNIKDALQKILNK